jgi:uncharacterized membrane-anchored protein YhcB (DUF1043 family)
MPYVFPYEDLFIGLVTAVIIGALLARLALVRRLHAKSQSGDRTAR